MRKRAADGLRGEGEVAGIGGGGRGEDYGSVCARGRIEGAGWVGGDSGGEIVERDLDGAGKSVLRGNRDVYGRAGGAVQYGDRRGRKAYGEIGRRLGRRDGRLAGATGSADTEQGRPGG